jgi:hypothetical protein
MPTGTPLSTGMEAKTAMGQPAATSASALSNTQALAGSRRDPLARCFMT